MNYSAANYGRRIGYTALASVLAATAAGCATRGRVQKVEDAVRGLESRVVAVEQKPLAEGPIMVTKSQNPVEFGMLLGQLLSQYRDKTSKETAERYANAVTVIPTNDQKRYYAVVMRDTNKDSQPTRDKDRTYADGTGPEMRIGFDLNTDNLPQNVRDWLLNVRSR